MSVSMALLVLLSTLSITIEKHYCADKLVDVAVFTKAKGCCPASAHKNEESSKEGCCKNETDLVVGQDELAVNQSETIKAPQEVFLISFAYVFGGLCIEEAQQELLFNHYSPPKLRRNIHVLHEVYLI